MTRKNKTKQKIKKPSKIDNNLDGPVQQLSVLINEAETAFDTFSYEEAESKLTEALKIDADNTKALEMLSSIYIEQSKWEEALVILKRCVEISPSEGYSKYFSLAQICEGKEALETYKKGIEIIKRKLENGENISPSEDKNKPSLERSLSDAYCSIAEIFMTDCCDEENAEENCTDAINSAINSDPLNPDAYSCLAGFHLLRERLQESKEAIEKSLSFWLPQHEALRDGESNEMENSLPGHDSRLKTSKILIELEMFEEATKILEGLIAEDDEIVEFWYLLGLVNYLQGNDYKYNAHFFFQKAKEVSLKSDANDVEMVSHIDKLIEELSKEYPLDEEEGGQASLLDDEIVSSSDSEKEMEM